MKKLLLLVTSFIFIFVFITSCTSLNKAPSYPQNEQITENLNTNEVDKIKERGFIVLGTSADYAPYEFHALINGKDEIIGFDIDIAREIAKDLGVNLKIKDMSFDGLLNALNSDQVDMVISGMTPTKERAEAIDFSNIYYKAKQTLVIRNEDISKYNSIDSLKGKKIAAQKSSIQEKIVKENFSESILVPLTKVPNVILELKNKNVDAAIIETPVAEGYIKNHPDLAASTLDLSFIEVDGGSAIAIKKGNKALVNEVNKVIKRLIDTNLIDEFIFNANEFVNNNL